MGIVCLTIGGNALNLAVPQLLARTIDTFTATRGMSNALILEFAAVAIGVFVLAPIEVT